MEMVTRGGTTTRDLTGSLRMEILHAKEVVKEEEEVVAEEVVEEAEEEEVAVDTMETVTTRGSRSLWDGETPCKLFIHIFIRQRGLS
jgi:hypothetical protein